jgi:hypothetical protein
VPHRLVGPDKDRHADKQHLHVDVNFEQGGMRATKTVVIRRRYIEQHMHVHIPHHLPYRL